MKRKVLIIGGSSDIGIELVKIFLIKKNYNIHIHYNSNFINVKKFSRNCKLIKADLSSSNYKKNLKKFNNDYDIVVNLIGYMNGKSFEKFNLKTIEKTLRTNSYLPLMIIRKSLKKMIENKWGRIINSSSIGVKFGGGKTNFEYSLSKHVNEFIPSYIRNLADKNIFYNTVKIGLTDTKIHKKILNKNITKRKKLVPVKRMASAKNIANFIFYYLSEENQFVTNETVSITGGE